MIALVLATVLNARITAARELAAKYVESHHLSVRERKAELGNADEVLIRYDQIASGVRVYSGQLNLYIRGSKVVVGYNGLRPEPHVDVHPKIGSGEAASIAGRRTTLTERIVVGRPELVVVPRSSFARNLPSADRLAWQVDVNASHGTKYSHTLFIDAQNGQLLYDLDQVRGF